jgi:hypothetical protein
MNEYILKSLLLGLITVYFSDKLINCSNCNTKKKEIK